LLVVRTDQINHNIEQLASFAGIKDCRRMNSKAHSFPAKAKFGLLSKIDHNYLNTLVNRHCRDLLKMYFPDIAEKANYKLT
jgi:hypothetical protein